MKKIALYSCDNLSHEIVFFPLFPFIPSAICFGHHPCNDAMPLYFHRTSPEAMSTSKYTAASDVWSFAVVVCEIFSNGATPYASWDLATVIKNVQAGERMAQPSGCPLPLYLFLLECWHVDANSRPSFGKVHNFLLKLMNPISHDANASAPKRFSTGGVSLPPAAALETSKHATSGSRKSNKVHPTAEVAGKDYVVQTSAKSKKPPNVPMYTTAEAEQGGAQHEGGDTKERKGKTRTGSSLRGFTAGGSTTVETTRVVKDENDDTDANKILESMLQEQAHQTEYATLESVLQNQANQQMYTTTEAVAAATDHSLTMQSLGDVATDPVGRLGKTATFKNPCTDCGEQVVGKFCSACGGRPTFAPTHVDEIETDETGAINQKSRAAGIGAMLIEASNTLV